MIQPKNRNISFEYPINPDLNQTIQKKYLPKFPYQKKNPKIEHFKHPQKPFDHPCRLKSGVPPPSPPPEMEPVRSRSAPKS